MSDQVIQRLREACKALSAGCSTATDRGEAYTEPWLFASRALRLIQQALEYAEAEADEGGDGEENAEPEEPWTGPHFIVKTWGSCSSREGHEALPAPGPFGDFPEHFVEYGRSRSITGAIHLAMEARFEAYETFGDYVIYGYGEASVWRYPEGDCVSLRDIEGQIGRSIRYPGYWTQSECRAAYKRDREREDARRAKEAAAHAAERAAAREAREAANEVTSKGPGGELRRRLAKPGDKSSKVPWLNTQRWAALVVELCDSRDATLREMARAALPSLHRGDHLLDVLPLTIPAHRFVMAASACVRLTPPSNTAHLLEDALQAVETWAREPGAERAQAVVALRPLLKEQRFPPGSGDTHVAWAVERCIDAVEAANRGARRQCRNNCARAVRDMQATAKRLHGAAAEVEMERQTVGVVLAHIPEPSAWRTP